MLSLDQLRPCVVGLGYVGLPLATLLASKYPTVGFDHDARRIAQLQQGYDRTGEVDTQRLQAALQGNLQVSADEADIRQCNFYIVAVPTPVDDNNRPDLHPLLSASEVVGRVLSQGDVVVYESTVYPGVTEETCFPVLEHVSGLTLNQDFFGGYSPERVNPGDRSHPVESIRKVTSGSTPEAARLVDQVYNSILTGGTHLAPSIRVAEASKIIENTQRDVNIAFVNELAKIFAAMGIDTRDVLEAASTKWNFIPMQPGLVGGHCISVDPYYLIERSQLYGVLPRVIMNARRLNNSMGTYVANQTIRLMNLRGLMVKDARILIMGFTFKENCPDIRNTKVVDICRTFSSYTSNITILDPHADPEQVKHEYGLQVVHQLPAGSRFDAAVLAVAHDEFRKVDVRALVPEPGVVFDVKAFLPRQQVDARL